MGLTKIVLTLACVLIATHNVASICTEKCQEYDDNENTCKECQAGWYGEDCSFECPENCKPNSEGEVHCNIYDSTCLEGCMVGWWGHNCSRECGDPSYCSAPGCNQYFGYCEAPCPQGRWGLMCQHKCNPNCKHNKCGSLHGICRRCKNGWSALQCNMKCLGTCKKCSQSTGECFRCPRSFYGNNCSLECSDNCKGHKCDVKGRCSKGCKEGFTGSTCHDMCPDNCLSCKQDDIICTKCKHGWTGETCETWDEEVGLDPLGKRRDPDEEGNGVKHKHTSDPLPPGFWKTIR